MMVTAEVICMSNVIPSTKNDSHQRISAVRIKGCRNLAFVLVRFPVIIGPPCTKHGHQSIATIKDTSMVMDPLFFGFRIYW
jgi:hypothetical protein